MAPTNEIAIKLSIDGKDAIGAIQLTDQNVKKLYNTFKSGIGDIDSWEGSMLRSMNNARQFIQGAREALSVLNNTFKQHLTAYYEQEQSSIKLATALQQQKRYTEDNYKALLDYASQLQRTTIYGDEQIITIEAQLQAMGLNVEQTKIATLQAANLATVMGTDLNSAARVMGDLFAGDATMINRYIKGLDESILKSGDFDAILATLNEHIGNQAIATGQTAYGGLIKMQNAIGDLKENTGMLLSQAFYPFAQLLSDLLNKLNTLSPTMGGIIGVVGSLTTAYVTLRVTGILPAIKSVELFGIALTGLKAKLISTGIGALIIGLGYGFLQLTESYNTWQNTIEKGVQSNIEAMNSLAEGMRNLSKEQIELAKRTYEQNLRETEQQIEKIKKQIEESYIIVQGHIYRSKETKELEEQLRILDLQKKSYQEYIEMYSKGVPESSQSPVPQPPGTISVQQPQKIKSELSEAEKLRIDYEVGFLPKEEYEKKLKERLSALKGANYDEKQEMIRLQRDLAEITKQGSEESYGNILDYARISKEQELEIWKKTEYEKVAQYKNAEEMRAAIDEEYNRRKQELDKESYGNVLDYARISKEQELEIWKKTEYEKVAQYKNAEEMRAAIDEEYSRRKMDLTEETERIRVEAIKGSFNFIAGAVGKDTALGKAAAIAQAMINTFEAATNALKAGPILGPILASVITAAGMANVVKIMAVKEPSIPAYQEGGRLPQGKFGFVEGFNNELIAPEKSFESIMKYELIPKIIAQSPVINTRSLEIKLDKVIDAFQSKQFVVRGYDLQTINKELELREKYSY